MRHLLSSLFVLLLLAGCGSSSDDSTGDTELASDSDVAGEAALDAPVVEEPAPERHYFGQNGNLWKPSGDDHGAGGGNLVVLFSSQFSEQFDSCEVATVSGEVAQLRCINDQPWTQIPYSCFSNGNRQTWRANFKCSHAADVFVTCYRDGRPTEFAAPDQWRNNVCSRIG